MKLDIGCGNCKKEGYIGIDIADHSKMYKKGEFIRHDMDKNPLPLQDNSVSKIYSKESLEHFRNFEFVISEWVRVCKPDAEIEIIVPHNVSEGAFYEEHFKFFRSKSFQREYRTEKLPYSVKQIKILYWKKPFIIFFRNYFFEWFFNLHPAIFQIYHKTGWRYRYPAWWFYFKLGVNK